MLLFIMFIPDTAGRILPFQRYAKKAGSRLFSIQSKKTGFKVTVKHY